MGGRSRQGTACVARPRPTTEVGKATLSRSKVVRSPSSGCEQRYGDCRLTKTLRHFVRAETRDGPRGGRRRAGRCRRAWCARRRTRGTWRDAEACASAAGRSGGRRGRRRPRGRGSRRRRAGGRRRGRTRRRAPRWSASGGPWTVSPATSAGARARRRRASRSCARTASMPTRRGSRRRRRARSPRRSATCRPRTSRGSSAQRAAS